MKEFIDNPRIAEIIREFIQLNNSRLPKEQIEKESEAMILRYKQAMESQKQTDWDIIPVGLANNEELNKINREMKEEIKALQDVAYKRCERQYGTKNMAEGEYKKTRTKIDAEARLPELK